jgi:LuxR family maltose regulon positive regulatory protein
MLAAIRALVASFRGDLPDIIRFSRRALDFLPEGGTTWRTWVAMALGSAYRFSGDMLAANQAYSEAVASSQAAGNVFLTLIAGSRLAIGERLCGRLRRVVEICRQQLRLLSESGLSQTAMAGGPLAMWGEVLCEWNDLDGAMDCLRKSVALSERGRHVAGLGLGYLSLLEVLFSRQDEVGVQETISKLEKLARESDLPVWIAVGTAAWKVRIWIAQGKLEAAAQLLEERGLNVDDDITYLREAEYLLLARLLTAQGKHKEAAGLLARLLRRAETEGRVAWVIAVRVLQALTFQAQGDIAEAIASLERALSLAEPEGYVRVFVNEGLPMAQLLYQVAARGMAPEYAGQLLAAFDLETKPPEPLSERELEVLQLIAEGLSNREIGEELSLSVNTVKVHAYNTYGKLGVHSRTQAVAQAKMLGLLPSGPWSVGS